MKRKFHAGIRAAVVFLAGGLGGPAFGIGFVNGGFEAPDVGDIPGYSATTPTGWTLENGVVSLNRNGSRGRGNAHGGSQYIFLPETDGTTQAGLTQIVTGLTPGIAYKFSIWLAAFNNTASAGSCYVRIGRSSDGDPLIGALLFDIPANSTVIGTGGSAWQQRTAIFTATVPTETFELYTIRGGTDLAYAAMDDVSLGYGFNGFPTVKIARNGKKITVTKAKYNLAGTAQSRIPIQQVVIRAGARQVIATGTNVWLGKVRLKKGRNQITVQATDAAGTASQPPARITIVRASKQATSTP